MFKTCIDPGHAGGGTDPGACNANTGLQEADINLAIGKLLASYLDAAGCAVKITRTEQEQPETDDLSYRTNLSNEWEADCFVSLHCNSAGTTTAKGFEVWTSPGQTLGDALATCIFKQIQSTFPDMLERVDYSDGDPDKESKFYVLTQTDAPACLIEMGFISNDAEAARLSDNKFQDDMARAIARGITDYIRGPF